MSHRKSLSRYLAPLVAFCGLWMIGSTPARAGLLIQNIDVQEVNDPQFQYVITLLVPDGCTIVDGDFFTIYDVFLPPAANKLSSVSPSGWSLTTPALGQTPLVPDPQPTDLPTILNLSWSYHGPTISGPFLYLDGFSVIIDQPVATLTQLQYTSTCQGMGDKGVVTPQLVPEPAALVSLAGGLGLVFMACRRKGRTLR